MKTMNGTDWSVPELQRAAVEWVWGQIGPRPGRDAGRGEWRGELARLVGALGEGVTAQMVEEWMGNDKYKPVDARAKAPVREMDDETVIAHVAAPADLLGDLLEPECDVMGESERMELARALEVGQPLDRVQRLAVATVLRGSESADRAELLRKLIAFLVPEESGQGRRRVWVMRETTIRMPAGAVVEEVGCGVRVPGFYKCGEQCVVVRAADGGVYAMRLFARVKTVKGGLLKLVQLMPGEEFASPLVVRRLAVLESLLHADRTCEGKRLAKVLHLSEPGVHYIRKGIVEKVKAATEGRAGFAGLRNKDQSNKGRKKMTSRSGAETAVGNTEGQNPKVEERGAA